MGALPATCCWASASAPRPTSTRARRSITTTTTTRTTTTTIDHGHDEFESFVVDLAEIADPAAFQRAVAEAIGAHDILRLKGFAAVAGKPMRLTVQAVGPRVDAHYDRPFAAGEPRRPGWW